MTCRHCGAWNPEHEHRCVHCSRRLPHGPARPAPDTYPIERTSLAPHLETRGPEPVVVAGDGKKPPTQGSLFSAAALRGEHTKVIPFTPVEPRRESPVKVQAGPHARRHISSRQQRICFPTPHETHEAAEEGAIYCDAPVAAIPHRMMAGALDTSMILLACASFLLTFRLFGLELAFNRPALILCALVVGLVAVLYHGLWALSGLESIGLRSVGLRLVNFDGERPKRGQRVARYLAGWLGLAACGMGLVWALIDEERLTWHDHISKTFPTPLKGQSPARYPIPY